MSGVYVLLVYAKFREKSIRKGIESVSSGETQTRKEMEKHKTILDI